MSKSELWNVLNFVRDNGAVLETQIWRKFLQSDTLEERGRVRMMIEELDYKGYIQHGYNKNGDCVVVYTGNNYH